MSYLLITGMISVSDTLNIIRIGLYWNKIKSWFSNNKRGKEEVIATKILLPIFILINFALFVVYSWMVVKLAKETSNISDIYGKNFYNIISRGVFGMFSVLVKIIIVVGDALALKHARHRVVAGFNKILIPSILFQILFISSLITLKTINLVITSNDNRFQVDFQIYNLKSSWSLLILAIIGIDLEYYLIERHAKLK